MSDPASLLDKKASRIRLGAASNTAEVRYAARSQDGVVYARSSSVALPQSIVDLLFAAVNDALVIETASARAAAEAHRVEAERLESFRAHVETDAEYVENQRKAALDLAAVTQAAADALASEQAQHDRALADFASTQENVHRQVGGLTKREEALGQQAKHVEQLADALASWRDENRRATEELAQRERIVALRTAELDAREKTLEARRAALSAALNDVGSKSETLGG